MRLDRLPDADGVGAIDAHLDGRPLVLAEERPARAVIFQRLGELDPDVVARRRGEVVDGLAARRPPSRARVGTV